MNTATLQTNPDYLPTPRLAPALAILSAWLLLAVAVSVAGGFASTDGPLALAMPAAIVGPIAVFALAYAGSARVRDWALGLDTRVLVLVHTWRMVGLGFLMLYAFDLLPGAFAIPAGVGDAAAAAWALVVATGLYGALRVSRRHLLAWNAFGVADFVLAVTIGTLSRYGHLDAFSGGVSTAIMGEFPFVLIPAYVVPVLFIGHLVVYLQVKNGRETGTL